MPGLNCSREALSSSSSSSSSAALFHALGCPDAALLCGMNVSRLLAEATAQDLEDVCLSEEAYLARYRGPPRSPAFVPVCLAYLSILAVGVLGNSLTCAVILHYGVMQTPTNYYLLSLAASDLLVLLLGMPLELYEMWQNYPFLLGEGGCYFKIFLLETVCFASVLNVTALSVERYLAVVHPLKVKHLSTGAHVRKVIALLWLLAMLCAVPNTSVHGIEVLAPRFGREFPGSAICSVVRPTWVYTLIILVSTVAFFLLPMLLISVLYLLIGLRLHRERGASAEDGRCSFGPGGLSQSHHRRMSKRNLQVTKMLCVLVVVFGLCWAPFHVDRLMWSCMDGSSEQHLRVFEQVHIVSGVFFYLSSAVNPILYNLMSTRFREMFSHVVCYAKQRSAGSGLQMTQRSTLSEKTPSSTK